MRSPLEQLAARLYCPACHGTSWIATGTPDRGTLACTSCGAAYDSRRGVLDLGDAREDAQVLAERAAVRDTERLAELGGINDAFDDLADATGELRDALLALPYGNDSRYYREPGYFANVRASVEGFDFLAAHLDLRPGRRLLDLGADTTSSTSHFARRGLDCTAVDINHHLAVGRLFAEAHGAAYHLVRTDMRRAPFRDDTFDIVFAVSALHHNAELADVAATISRVVRPGGQLAFLEPYCASAEAKAAFGAAQIAAGISEQTYLLDEWHDAFTAAGFDVEWLRVCEAFCAVYRKRADPGDPRRPSGRGSMESLFTDSYRGRLTAHGVVPAVARGESWRVMVDVENASNAVWCSTSQFPVYVSYHLHRRDGAGTTLLAFDNVRTRLPHAVAPGERARIPLELAPIDAPGDYVADIDLVHEYVSWFAPRGFTGVMLPFTVR
jgi:SAM-dependent methyltransferase